jgi:hypothetical protein
MDGYEKKPRGLPEGAVAVIAGAGLSADSGIRTYRGAGGVYQDGSIPAEITREGYKKDPGGTRRYLFEWRAAMAGTGPGPSYEALRQLLEGRPGSSLITQNVDGLGPAALGAAGIPVVELHGNVHADREGGLPDIVLYGEQVRNMERAWTLAVKAKAVVVVGTSLQFDYLKDLTRAVLPECRYYIDTCPIQLRGAPPGAWAYHGPAVAGLAALGDPGLPGWAQVGPGGAGEAEEEGEYRGDLELDELVGDGFE